ncbi:hypothetical protein [Leucobacter sp. cx-169]|nr:hypothetical protein [Leucobacter sp. cx-169]MBC9927323.1 hypothetical protein [Leucobacter sp. cx-169]
MGFFKNLIEPNEGDVDSVAGFFTSRVGLTVIIGLGVLFVAAIIFEAFQ